MSRVTFSPAAIADIDGIWDYTAETWGVDQAEHYADDIRDTCNALAAGLKKGRAVDVREGYLKLCCGKALCVLCDGRRRDHRHSYSAPADGCQPTFVARSLDMFHSFEYRIQGVFDAL